MEEATATMKTRIYGLIALALALSACNAPPAVTGNTLESSTVDGTTLIHPHQVRAPRQFTPVYQAYRALYAASVMSTPGFEGQRLRALNNGEIFQVLGQVEDHWLAISDNRELQLTGYVEYKAGVPSVRYAETVKGAPPVKRRAAATQCIGVGNGDSACRKGRSATWVIN